MTELGLIVGIDVVGLALALLMWRGVSVRDSGSAAVRRLSGALERAARAFLWQEYRLIAITTFVLLVASIAASSTLSSNAASASSSMSPISKLGTAFWVAIGVCLGALGTTLSGFVGTLLAVRGSGRAAAACASSMDAALAVAMRAAGAGSLFCETLSGLCVASLFGLLFAVQGGFALASDQALPLASHVVLLLPSFVLGSAVSALVLQRGGGAFHAASGVGSDQAGERDAGLDHDDARNPAVVAELVGDHVGASATRAVDAFASASVANVAALLIGAALANAAPAADPLALIGLPLVVRAFGVIASGFGLLLVRTEETSSLPHAFLRGYLSTAAILLTSLAGTSYWLFGEHFLAVFCCGSLGLSSVLLAAHALLLSLGRRSAAMRDGSEGLRIGGGALVAAGLGSGLETALLPSSILAIGVALGISIGAHSGLTSGVEVGVLVFALGALSIAPFVLSIATLGSIADGARGVANVSGADAEVKRRCARLDDAGFLGSAVARQYAVVSGTLSTLLMAWAIASQGQSAGSSPSLAASSALVWCGAVGAAVMLGYAGSVARASVRCAREVSAEVERQLRGFPRDHGVAQVPLDYTPSYKTCVELTTTVSLRRTLGPIAAALAAPLALGLGLRLAFRTLSPELVPQGLTWFVVVASLTGLMTTLAVGAARATLGSIRRANSNRSRDGASAFHSAITADALSDIFGNAAAPALQLLVKATAAAALIITPFLV